MDDMVLSVRALPEHLSRRFHSDRVRVHEENGVVILTPVDTLTEQERAIDRLCGMFAGKLSTDDYISQKQIDKELEG